MAVLNSSGKYQRPARTYVFHNGSARGRVSFKFFSTAWSLLCGPVYSVQDNSYLLSEKKKAAFDTHAAVIAKQSQGLDILTNGAMAEALDGKSHFEDVQEDTFVQLECSAYQ